VATETKNPKGIVRVDVRHGRSNGRTEFWAISCRFRIKYNAMFDRSRGDFELIGGFAPFSAPHRHGQVVTTSILYRTTS
jgi:hypothetical protein